MAGGRRSQGLFLRFGPKNRALSATLSAIDGKIREIPTENRRSGSRHATKTQKPRAGERHGVRQV